MSSGDARGDDVPDDDALAVELARRAQRGDREAFGRLAERFHAVVHGIALAHGPRREVRDLVQEVFLLALRSIGRLEDPKRFPGWLASIARNAARDAHRRSRDARPNVRDAARGAHDADPRVRALRGDSDGLADELVAPDQPPHDDGEEAERALAAVRSLPDAYRETLILRLVEGLSGPEIAARTGMTHGSVRVNLTRGMKLLRERLEREGPR
ncbi:MAG: sigma-70 family RNA polymerase sigma factor [Planctomycetes bacterium]|nr:sigma-70 family RNA polymerase sigma factor [Planctomycetota bacterium]